MSSRIVVAGMFSLVIAGCGLADLRPADLRRTGVSDEAVRRGAAVLERMEQAHGGVEQFRSHRTMQVEFEEHWPSRFYGLLLNSWPDDPQRIGMSWLIDRDQVRAEILSGKHTGQVSGVQNWCFYAETKLGSRTFKTVSTNRRLLLPTLAFWYEVPLRIREATIKAWAGERTEAGRTYDLLFATWNRAEPQKTIDQYLLWVDRETGRLTYVQLTVRDFAGWGEAVVSYEGWHEVDAILVPGEIKFRYGATKLSDSVTRVVKTEQARFGLEKQDDWFVPEPGRRCRK